MQARSRTQSSSVNPRKSSSAARTVPESDLTKIFHTAMVSTQQAEKKKFSVELSTLSSSVAFQAILNSVRQLSAAQGIPERQAAVELIQTFRKMDLLWKDYLFQEGIEKLRNQRRSR